jgi:hypothetical protein
MKRGSDRLMCISDIKPSQPAATSSVELKYIRQKKSLKAL